MKQLVIAIMLVLPMMCAAQEAVKLEAEAEKKEAELEAMAAKVEAEMERKEAQLEIQAAQLEVELRERGSVRCLRPPSLRRRWKDVKP